MKILHPTSPPPSSPHTPPRLRSITSRLLARTIRNRERSTRTPIIKRIRTRIKLDIATPRHGRRLIRERIAINLKRPGRVPRIRDCERGNTSESCGITCCGCCCGSCGGLGCDDGRCSSCGCVNITGHGDGRCACGGGVRGRELGMSMGRDWGRLGRFGCLTFSCCFPSAGLGGGGCYGCHRSGIRVAGAVGNRRSGYSCMC